MRTRVLASALAAAAFLATSALAQQTYKAPRTSDGAPNINGIWQAMNTADWDLRPHAASQGPLLSLGAEFSVPPGPGVIDGDGTIPYLPAAAEQQKKNFANRLTLDPEVKCYMGGVPRSTYMPYPFKMEKPTEAPADSWMGWSSGHWEGDTLVVTVTGLNDQTWFDRAGDFHSDALKVTERYTPRSADTLLYEATIEDSKTFSRPWKISMPLYRHVEKDAQLLEYKCPEFAEEVVYGKYRKQPAK
jgi:hypothetical protein